MEALLRFPDRHIGPRSADIAKMLAEIGADSLDDLVAQTVPAGIRTDRDLVARPGFSETAVAGRTRRIWPGRTRSSLR